jgi:type II secretory pathway pseudopilin PulG
MIPGRHTVTPQRLQRGATLLEAMIAMGVLLIGAAGLIGLQRQSMFLLADSREATRAAAFAQDLATQIELWDYSDPRLVNTNTANDADPTAGFESDTPTQPPDHGEADLIVGGDRTTWTGLPVNGVDPVAVVDPNLSNGKIERYWNVSYVDDVNGNGIWDSVRVAIIVRWKPAGRGADGTWRVAAFFVVKPNPAEML